MSPATLGRRARALRLLLAVGLGVLAAVALARYVAGVSGDTPVVVAFGDSLTEGGDGVAKPWPTVLAERLTGRSGEGRVRVVNAGISGNRLLHEGFGPSGLSRFEDEALRRPGVRWVIVLEGINDLGFPGAVHPDAPRVTAEELIAGYRQVIRQARARGVKIYGGTLLPFEGAAGGYFAPDKERVRQAVNGWIRTSGEIDGVIDFEAAVRDPSRPTRLLSAYDAGDHLHLNPAGHRAMGGAVDLGLFRVGGP